MYCRCDVDGGRGQTENSLSEFVVYCQFSNFGIFNQNNQSAIYYHSWDSRSQTIALEN